MSKSFTRLLAFGGLALAGSLLPASARVAAVYAPAGRPAVAADLRAVALAALNGQTPSGTPYTVLISETSRLTKAFSILPGVTAYFVTDQPLVLDADFAMTGESMTFEGVTKGSLSKQGTPATEKVFPTALLGASFGSGSLQLRYSAAAAGKSSLEVYGLDGHSFGKWTWNDAAAGEHSRSFQLRSVPQGAFILKWKNGSVRAIQRLLVDGTGAKP